MEYGVWNRMEWGPCAVQWTDNEYLDFLDMHPGCNCSYLYII